ncbi:hypothetical protein B0J12DRAFT_677945, partial [Macrophomina phaseolina]
GGGWKRDTSKIRTRSFRCGYTIGLSYRAISSRGQCQDAQAEQQREEEKACAAVGTLKQSNSESGSSSPPVPYRADVLLTRRREKEWAGLAVQEGKESVCQSKWSDAHSRGGFVGRACVPPLAGRGLPWLEHGALGRACVCGRDGAVSRWRGRCLPNDDDHLRSGGSRVPRAWGVQQGLLAAIPLRSSTAAPLRADLLGVAALPTPTSGGAAASFPFSFSFPSIKRCFSANGLLRPKIQRRCLLL